MKISYDKLADALYLSFEKEHKSVKTVEIDGVLVDYDKNSKVLGVEVLNFMQKKAVEVNLNVCVHIEDS